MDVVSPSGLIVISYYDSCHPFTDGALSTEYVIGYAQKKNNLERIETGIQMMLLSPVENEL